VTDPDIIVRATTASVIAFTGPTSIRRCINSDGLRLKVPVVQSPLLDGADTKVVFPEKHGQGSQRPLVNSPCLLCSSARVQGNRQIRLADQCVRMLGSGYLE
jgi:hypothetical protein